MLPAHSSPGSSSINFFKLNEATDIGTGGWRGEKEGGGRGKDGGGVSCWSTACCNSYNDGKKLPSILQQVIKK